MLLGLGYLEGIGVQHTVLETDVASAVAAVIVETPDPLAGRAGGRSSPWDRCSSWDPRN